MERVQETLEQIQARKESGTGSEKTSIWTEVWNTDDYLIVVEAHATFPLAGQVELAEATASRVLDPTGHDELTIKQVIDASKRDALRELVTQLQLHEVL